MYRTTIIKILFLASLLFAPLLALQSVDNTRGAIAFELYGDTILHEEKNTQGIFEDINISIYLFKTSNTNIRLENINKYDEKFKLLDRTERFQDTKKTLWLKIDVGEYFPNGDFVTSYGDSRVLEHSFSLRQGVDLFTIGDTEHMKFSYNNKLDSSVYYFKLSSVKYKNTYRYLFITTKKSFYEELNDDLIVMLMLGVIIGLIFMAGLYNGAMYYYNKDKSFLYYMLMQWSVTVILINMIGVMSFLELEISRSEAYYSLCSLFGILFTTLFTKTFLDTKTHTPKFDMMLNVFIGLIFIDMLFSIFYVSIIFKYHLLPFFALSYIYLGFKRVRQGFKPAIFYLAGWTFLVTSLFLDAFWKFVFIVNPIFLGTAIEAIFFSFALSYKIKMMNEEKEQQKELLVHQSKLASMGEMIGNIAHQWRQPLTHLSYSVMNIQDAFKHNALDEVYLDKKVDEATKQIEYMSQTIDDFKNFYEPVKIKEDFSLEEATKEVLEIMGHALKVNNIEVDLFVRSNVHLFNHKNEYKQVLLNLLSNAKDALVEKKIKEPKILIMISESNVHNAWLTVSDNAGGIGLKNINQIFEPYFTTKEGNSGIGLYMSKMIIEKNMGGKLTVRNENEGAMFSLIF